jgi:hypothetical protein
MTYRTVRDQPTREVGTGEATMPLPPGIIPTPPAIRQESGIPMAQPQVDRTAPQSLAEMAKRAGRRDG